MAGNRQRNRFAQVVTRNTLRSTETVVTIIENGATPRDIGEFITFVPNRTPNVDPVPIGGESGYRHQKRTSSTRNWTATFYTGTDGSFWEMMDDDEDQGVHRPFTFMTSDKDDTAPAVGEAVRAYYECRLNSYEDSGMTTDGRKITTIGGTFERKELVRGFDTIQGVLR